MDAIAILGFGVSVNVAAEMLIVAQGNPELGWRPMGWAAAANALIGAPLIAAMGVRGALLGNAATSLMAAGLLLRAAASSRSARLHNGLS